MTDITIEDRVRQVADRLRAKPEFLALLFKDLCGDKVRVAGTWFQRGANLALPDLSNEGHLVSIIFPQETGSHPFKWLVYSPSGSPTRTGFEETMEEAITKAENEVIDLGIVLTYEQEKNPDYTVSEWISNEPIYGALRFTRMTSPIHNETEVAYVEEQRDGSWIPWVQGCEPFKPFHRREDAKKAVDDILRAHGHVLPPGSVGKDKEATV